MTAKPLRIGIVTDGRSWIVWQAAGHAVRTVASRQGGGVE